jgi:hypothetical protein
MSRDGWYEEAFEWSEDRALCESETVMPLGESPKKLLAIYTPGAPAL